MLTSLLLIFMLFFPWLAQKMHAGSRWPTFLSPVILCYGSGILLANSGILPADFQLAEEVSEVSILLAIPFLLYAVDLAGWWRSAGSITVSFGLAVGSAVAAAVLHAWLWSDILADTPRLSGMLSGLYSGGTPNLNAVGRSLEVSAETIIYMNAADIVTGGLYLLFLTSAAPFIFGKILPAYQTQDIDNEEFIKQENGLTLAVIFKSGLLTSGIVAAAAGGTWLWTGALKSVGLILLLLTTFSVAASLIPTVRHWTGTFTIGEYLLLIFCTAIGLSADFSEVPAEAFLLAGYTAAVLLTTVILHLVLCRLRGIDRDTMLITSTAALYGPPFVAQMVSVLGNRQVLFGGMASGLAGYAVGNYLGILTAELLAHWLH